MANIVPAKNCFPPRSPALARGLSSVSPTRTRNILHKLNEIPNFVERNLAGKRLSGAIPIQTETEDIMCLVVDQGKEFLLVRADKGSLIALEVSDDSSGEVHQIVGFQSEKIVDRDVCFCRFTLPPRRQLKGMTKEPLSDLSDPTVSFNGSFPIFTARPSFRYGVETCFELYTRNPDQTGFLPKLTKFEVRIDRQQIRAVEHHSPKEVTVFNFLGSTPREALNLEQENFTPLAPTDTYLKHENNRLPK